jgi:hypothetical protein
MAKKSSAPLHRRKFMLYLQEKPGYEHPLVIKESASEFPTRSQIAQINNEYVITKHLVDVPGVRPDKA